MAGGVERRDDQVLAGDTTVVQRAAVLVDQREARHGHELARELPQAEVQVVVAGVDGAGDQMAAVDAQ